MRNKVIAALVAGGLLVGAGFATSIVSAPSIASAQEETTGGEEGKGIIPRALEFLGGVLDELVGEGTISQEDADAVLDAVENKAVEIREERKAVHDAIKAALDDGVLTKQEALDAGVPEDHWLFTAEALQDAWEDGQLTTEEIREARPHPRRDFFKKGLRFGALLDDGGIDAAEFAEIPDDHPLKQVEGIEDLLESDGLITHEELRELWQQFKANQDA